MLANGRLKVDDLRKEIGLGYFRPSLMRDIKYRHLLPSFALGFWDKRNVLADKLSGYVPHKEVYAAKKRRQAAIAEYEARRSTEQASADSGVAA